MRTWRIIACSSVALVVAACSTAQMTPATTLNGLPPSKPIPAVVTSATPAGWVPVAYGDAQVSVPASFSVYYSPSFGCPQASFPGSLYVGPPRVERQPRPCDAGLPSISANEVVLQPWRYIPYSPVGVLPRLFALNGVRVYAVSAHVPSGVNVPERFSNHTYLVAPSLSVEVSASGPLAHRILATFTRSPRAVALAPGPAPSIPAGWHTVTFQGLSFSVPSSWPVTRTAQGFGIGDVCLTPGVSLGGRHVTLSTDLHNVILYCPYELPRPQPPTDGVQIDAGSNLELPPGLSFSTSCLHVNRLTACPATSPAYSILVLKVTVPGPSTPVLVSIGLAGNGLVARTILYSLRAA